ncbi:MAG: lysozyme [Gammaproteobacteria bacterium]|nr:lysozyme [Gammaproteobacteria bacterium]
MNLWWILGGALLLLVTRKAGAKTLIREFEGLSLDPYKDPAGILHVGYGHRLATGDPVNQITKAQAEQMLNNDVLLAAACVQRNVVYSLNNRQKDALTSFVFNVGCGAFASSTLLKYLNAGDVQRAADEFSRWTKAGGKDLPGLVTRRAREREIFLS